MDRLRPRIGGRAATSGSLHRRQSSPSAEVLPPPSPLSSNAVASPPPDLACCNGSTRFNLSDIVELCNGLFDILHQQLDHLLSGAIFSLHTNSTSVSPKGFLQLVRCCLIMIEFVLPFPEFKTLSADKCRVLIYVLQKLCPPNSSLSTKDAAPASFLCTILEVFIHEILLHQQLREHLAATYYDLSTSEKLFAPCESHGHINPVLELVSSHFLLSINDKWTFSKFTSSLSWSIKADSEIPEVGLVAALALLGDTFMSSAPYILQAHLTLLTSRCIGIRMPTCDGNLNNLLAAFELSVKLYGVYMPSSDFFDNFIGGGKNQSSGAIGVPFDPCIRQATYDKLNHHISNLANLCCYGDSHGVPFEAKGDISTDLDAYIIENQHVIDEMFRDETRFILNYIISNILPGETEMSEVPENGEHIRPEMYCLAAAMKLMSSSLLQILWHLKRDGPLKGRAIHREYDILSNTISCLGEYGASQTIQELLLPVMGTHHRSNERKLILAHFASLLSYSFRKRFQFYWRGCVFMMMALMNLFLSEDGNLDAFQQLLNNMEESSVHQNSPANTPKALVSRRSSRTIASSFQNVQKLYLKEQAKLLTYENQWMDNNGINVQEGELGVNLMNGEAYLAALPGYCKRPSEFDDDLVDFIACTPGKDYREYLRNRCRFWWWGRQKRVERRKTTMQGVRKKTSLTIQVVGRMEMAMKRARKRRNTSTKLEKHTY